LVSVGDDGDVLGGACAVDWGEQDADVGVEVDAAMGTSTVPRKRASSSDPAGKSRLAAAGRMRASAMPSTRMTRGLNSSELRVASR
jgi:hypothetical protein